MGYRFDKNGVVSIMGVLSLSGRGGIEEILFLSGSSLFEMFMFIIGCQFLLLKEVPLEDVVVGCCACLAGLCSCFGLWC